LDQIDSHVAELRRRKTVVEISLTSRIPAAGSLVVAIRRFFGWLATVWFVRPLYQQQNVVNDLVLDTLTHLATFERTISNHLAEDTVSSHALVESTVQTERLLAQLNRELARLERRIRDLERLRPSVGVDQTEIVTVPRLDE
jgi:hypothetical protein